MVLRCNAIIVFHHSLPVSLILKRGHGVRSRIFRIRTLFYTLSALGLGPKTLQRTDATDPHWTCLDLVCGIDYKSLYLAAPALGWRVRLPSLRGRSPKTFHCSWQVTRAESASSPNVRDPMNFQISGHRTAPTWIQLITESGATILRDKSAVCDWCEAASNQCVWIGVEQSVIDEWRWHWLVAQTSSYAFIQATGGHFEYSPWHKLTKALLTVRGEVKIYC